MVADLGKRSDRELIAATNRVSIPGHHLPGGVIRSDCRPESGQRPASSVLRIQCDQGDVNERRVRRTAARAVLRDQNMGRSSGYVHTILF